MAALRELLFSIGFKGDASPIKQMDTAADGLKKTMGGVDDKMDSVIASTKSLRSQAASLAGEYRKAGMSQSEAMKQAWSEIERTKKETQGATAAAKEHTQAMTDMSGKMAITGGVMTAAITRPIINAGKSAFQMASDFEENVNKVDVAFKDNAQSVMDWSKTTLESFGISQSAALEAASLFGDMGTAMGLSTGEAANMSTSLTGLAGDLASFKNIGIDQAQTALKGIFTGEGESLKTLGIIMQDSTLEAFALAQGTGKAWKEMDQAEKVALRYAVVMDATKNSQGDFANTSDGAANSSRILSETMKELGVSFGQVLLPVITPIIQKITELVKWFGSLSQGTKTAIVIVGAVFAALGPLLLGASGAIMAVTAAQTALNAVMLMNPIGLIVMGIAALIAGLVYFYNTNESVRNSINAIWTSLQAFMGAAMEQISALWATHGESIMAVGAAVWGAISLLIETIMGIISGIIVTFLAIITGDWEGAWNGLKGIVESIMKWFGGLGQAFMDIGKNIIDGIINGIKAKARAAVDAVKNVAKNMADAFTSFWGINSPATLGIEFGGYIPEGVAIGVKDKAVKVQQATQQMSNMAGSGMSTQGATRQTAGAGGGFNFSPQITVNVNGGGTVKESFSSIEQQLNLFMDEYAQKMALRNPKVAY